MSTLHGIQIDDTNAPEGYSASIAETLNAIERNAVGRVVLTAINFARGNNRTSMTIKHFSDGTAAGHGKCNSTTKSIDFRGEHPKGIRPFKGKDDNFRTPDDERYRTVDGSIDHVSGTGMGSNVTVYATPFDKRSFPCTRVGPGSAFDEGLLHEMVHGLRSMQGMSLRVPTEDGAKRYDNEEEFLAIVTCNVYVSAKGGKRFRKDHNGYSVLRAPYDTSAGFLQDPAAHRIMSIHHLVWPTFRMLAEIPSFLAPFNPFRTLNNNLAYLR